MSSILDLTLRECIVGLNKKDFTSLELTKLCLNSIKKAKKLNAFITVNENEALLSAAKSDKRILEGKARSLEGVPLGVKDLFCTKGLLTTAASCILETFVPEYESTVTSNLLSKGAIMIGKTNLDEFAMGSSNETSFFGPSLNPWKNLNQIEKKLVPGGSSGGSAVSVAARLCFGSVGTDTGGSIRQPAAFNGLVGLKPTYGRCSRWGVIAFASSLDQAGPIARTVDDSALILSSMAGYDHKDSTSVNLSVPDFLKDIDRGVKGLKIGIPKEYRLDGLPEEIEKLWNQGIDWLKSAGAKVVDISLKHTKYALPAYYIVAPAEASSNLARYDGIRYGLRVDGETLDELYEKTRAEGFGEEVKRRVLMGTYVLSAGYYDAYYIKAQKIRSLILQDFQNTFHSVDAILTPTTPSAAFGVNEKSSDQISMYMNDVFTVPANMAGLPAISVPSGINKDGLPLGLQIIGKPFDECTIFRFGKVIENSVNLKFKPDTWWED